MAEQSKIEWTDSTFNGWEGCTKVGPGCDHCYAENRNSRFGGGTSPNWGPGAPRRKTSPANWNKPLRWNDTDFLECAECGWRGEGTDRVGHFGCPDCRGGNLKKVRRRVFSASLSDWLDNEVPVEWLAELLDLIRRTPNLDWLMLTKRIGNWRDRVGAAAHYATENWGGQDRLAVADFVEGWTHDQPPENVWVGATIVDQKEADRDIPKLLQVPALVRFLSMEPLLGPIDLSRYFEQYPDHNGVRIVQNDAGPDWIIAGGESGPGARPMHPAWARALRDQCEAADVAFLFKQWGEWIPGKDAHDRNIIPIEQRHPFGMAQPPMARVGKKLAGRTLDGKTWTQYPEPRA